MVWENLGPSHLDRIAACAAAGFEVTAVELFAESRVYQWEHGEAPGARRITLVGTGEQVGGIALAWRLLRALLTSRAQTVFLCHYNSFVVFAAAVLLRLAGRRVITMIDSKFDDYPRFAWRELGKVLLLAPYQAALVGSRRCADYLHFLGFGRRPVRRGFDALDLGRIRRAAGDHPAPPHAARDFLIVARLVAKKNLGFAIRAYAAWRPAAQHPRKLRIIGYGEQEAELRNLVAELGIADSVVFAGRLGSAEVSRAMRDALCLILPSVEEQFGLVVIEALAVGLPVLLSRNAGAADELLDNGVNGWIIDPRRPAGLEAALTLLDRDEAAWQGASAAAQASSDCGDVRHFVAAISALARPG